MRKQLLGHANRFVHLSNGPLLPLASLFLRNTEDDWYTNLYLQEREQEVISRLVLLRPKYQLSD